LTEKQQRFVEEYLIDLNATQAAIRAGYSAKTASAIGFENLRKPEIVAAVAKAQGKLSERTAITQEVVLAGLHREATLEGESQSARVAAWAHIGKHLGMFIDKQEITQVGPPSVMRVVVATDDAGWSKEAVSQQTELQQHPPSIPVEH
jgi:phage terminase small subunit